MNTAALQKAIEIVGGQTALARHLGLKQPHVWNWLNVAKRIPAEFVIEIEKATDGRVSRHELRPDIYPKDQTSSAAPKRAAS